MLAAKSLLKRPLVLLCVALVLLSLFLIREVVRLNARLADVEFVRARVNRLDVEIHAMRNWRGLDDRLACALAEKYVLEHGWDGHPARGFGSFRCDRKLSVGEAKATLQNVTFVQYANDTYLGL